MGKATLNGELMFPSEYVAAVEFKGRDVTLTIADVRMVELQRQDKSKDRKPVLFFRETPKKLVLNKTNAESIADQLGTEARKWIGKRVTLYPTTCSSFGQVVACIRVRPATNGGRKHVEPPPLSEDVNDDGDMVQPPIDEAEAARIAEREAAEAGLQPAPE